MTRYITPINRGDPVANRKARNKQNDIIQQVNTLTGATNPPKQSDKPLGAPASGSEDDDIQQGESAVTLDDVTWRELSRATSEVRIEDPNDEDVFVLVERIDSVTFVDPSGNIQRLLFNNT